MAINTIIPSSPEIRIPPTMPPTIAPALDGCTGTVDGSGLIRVNSIIGGITIGVLLPTELE
jgi:hypothetical protein